MKRASTVSVRTEGVDVTIKIVVDATKHYLTSGEVTALLSDLTDAAMRSLHATTYVHAPLHTIKVS